MKILLTGKTGQIGEELNNIIGDLGNLITVDKEQLDLSKPNSIEPVICLLYTSPSPRDRSLSRMPSSA